MKGPCGKGKLTDNMMTGCKIIMEKLSTKQNKNELKGMQAK